MIIETDGDRRAPDTAWGEGAFVAAIERALLDRRVDVAVHSAKDVPTDEDPRLRIAAYLPRADPRDALVVRTDATERRLADLPPGCPRRDRQPAAHGVPARPASRISRSIRSTATSTRDCAGSMKVRPTRWCSPALGWTGWGSATGSPSGSNRRSCRRPRDRARSPIQIRHDDARMLALAAAIDDRRTRQAVEAERAFLTASGGGCRSPIGALATDHRRRARPAGRLRQPGRRPDRDRPPSRSGRVRRGTRPRARPRARRGGSRSSDCERRRTGRRALERSPRARHASGRPGGRARVGAARRGPRSHRGSGDRDRVRATARRPRRAPRDSSTRTAGW